MQRQALRVALLKKRRANAISSADRSRRGCCRVVAPSGTPGAETTRALPSLSPLFSPIAPPASVYTMCGELPHGAARAPPQSWGDVGRKIPRGEGRTRVCYPHGWYQSVPHAHGVLRTARWACPHDLHAVRAAHPSARGPRKGGARTMGDVFGGSACFGGRSSPKAITLTTSTAKMRYTLGKLVSLPLKKRLRSAPAHCTR